MPSMRDILNIFETVIDINDRLKGKEQDDLVSRIKKAIASLPYREAERRRNIEAYHTDGRLPLPIGTKMLPPKGKGYPTNIHRIVGYHVDRLDPEMYGYEINSSDDPHISILWVCNPKNGIYEKRPDVVNGWTAMLGPNGATKMNYKPPQRKAEQSAPSMVSKSVEDEYKSLFDE